MLDIAKNFFDQHDIIISTNINIAKSKTKCIAFGLKNKEPIKIVLNDGRTLPWEPSWPHLGHILHNDESPKHDLMVKRGQFIGKLHSFRQEFGNLDPLVYIQLVSTYISSFYGSNLWDLYGEDSDKLYKSWNIMIRIIFNLPRETHKYLIEPISYKPHLKVQLVKRFISFCNSLKASDKPHLKYLMNLQMTDYRSTFGRNVVNICKDGGVDKISEVQPQNIIYAPVPPDDSWRIPLIQELLEVRAQRLQTILDPEEVLDLLNSLTIS